MKINTKLKLFLLIIYFKIIYSKDYLIFLIKKFNSLFILNKNKY